MDKREAIKLVKEYKELVTQHLPVKALYLYGSYSKGCHTDDSDIDVAVIVHQNEADWWENSSLLWSLCRKVSTTIEPILITEDNDSPLYNDILLTGIKI